MRKDEQVSEILFALKENGKIKDFRYDHFRKNKSVQTPFAVYRRVAGASFFADGKTYQKEAGVDIELYADNPNEMAEIMDQMNILLDANEMAYKITADTVYLSTEDFYESLYEL